MSENDIQMVPCCGHFLIANKDLSEVTISGCDNGLDWSVVHENGGVKLALPSGEEWVPLQEYQRAVIRFEDKVEAYAHRYSGHEHSVSAGSPVPFPWHGPQLGGEPRL